MLSKYLHNLRAAKKVTPAQALQTLGSSWNYQGDQLVKNYVFEDFHQAANFMQRYTEYC